MKFQKSCIVLSSLALLFGCIAKPFQPPPAEFLMWEKLGSLQGDVKLAMKQCDFNNLINNNGKMSDEEYAKSQRCMTAMGFRDRSGYDICKTRKGEKLASCQ